MDTATSLPRAAQGPHPSRLDRLARTRLFGPHMPGRRHRDRIAGVLALAAETPPGDEHLPESAEFRAMLDSYLSSPRPSVRQGNAILDVVSARLTALNRVDDALAALRLPLPGGAYCEEWDEAAWLRAARDLASDGDGDGDGGGDGAGVPELYRDWQVVLAAAELAFHTRPEHSDALPPSSAVEFTRPLRFMAASLAQCGAPAWGPEAQAVVLELHRVTRAYGRRRGRARAWSLRYLHRELPPHEVEGYCPRWRRWARAVGCGLRRLLLLLPTPGGSNSGWAAGPSI